MWRGGGGVSDEGEWYRDAVIYQLHVRAFRDSDGDGIGDLPGLTEKLDYLQDLGVTAIWLLPFYPSPLKDDGYDIADYNDVNPSYGTLQDFKTFLREAHRRGLRVITELVLNHTSDQHPWFQRARRARPGSRARDFYVWSKTANRYTDARIIFKDFERSNWTWDADAGAYYWHRFYSHQPDLNFDNPTVHKATFAALDFWLKMGVDGLRLDAVPYLYEREGTNCENLPETHAYLKELRRRVEAKYPDRMLLAEANQWPEDAVAYFGDGDECHMAFHFPVMPRLFMALQMEDRFPIIDILQQTPPIPERCQWAIFLRNHDELTLEMVTDEDRDYMYRVYASDPQARINLGIRRRLAPLMGNNRRRIELMNALLFSLPGTPIVYYGDEIGMGDNIYLGDRNGVRTPMQWSPDRNAGFSLANPQRLYFPVIIDPEYHYEALNVEAQQNNPHSLLWWMKHLIDLRRQYRAFGRGTLRFLSPDNPRVLAFVRQWGDERILVIANLSRFAQAVELDLAEFNGTAPVEMFGRTPFPRIGTTPYSVTLSPHAFYWFLLPAESLASQDRGSGTAPAISFRGSWQELIQGEGQELLEAVLPAYLRSARWYRSKARELASIGVAEVIPVPVGGDREVLVTLLETRFLDGDSELYVLPFAFADGERARDIMANAPQSIVVLLGDRGFLYDASADEGFVNALLEGISRRRRWRMPRSELVASRTSAFGGLQPPPTGPLRATMLRGEQSNTSINLGDRFLFKLFRKAEPGLNPDLEIGRHLTDEAKFRGAPLLAGGLELRTRGQEPITLGVLHQFVPSEGDAWGWTQNALSQYFERALVSTAAPTEADLGPAPLLERAHIDSPTILSDAAAYLSQVSLLGRRTAELHWAMIGETDNAAFAIEPFTSLYKRSLYQSLRSLTRSTFDQLRRRLSSLPDRVREEARTVLGMEDGLLRQARAVLERRLTSVRIRIHGDYHLGQVLFTGKDFVIVDFEGEPSRSLSERRFRRSPLRDVAGMIRSFEYASAYALRKGPMRSEDVPVLLPWARLWTRWTSTTFLRGYLQAAGDAPFLPKDPVELGQLLEFYLLDKTIYELRYELNNRPDWLDIPLEGILHRADAEAPRPAGTAR
ncbi:MAG: maltose alpha-D-glucosyltransferase [Gemmatimonadales bacterium]|nr:maltose alpha-D-glucosyltransferase [Gemmatimonadales bacterium]